MSDDVVIRAEGLGKKYTIGHTAESQRYVALRDVLAGSARSAWRKTVDMARGRAIVADNTVEQFWALKDVSFEVTRGAVLGIIGRNGAGKSTLLKVLSRITEPSEGRVTIRGRVASLLEVGTGFHPELTGRENIYLNGAILGMTRAEIRRKFDEIVTFAEIEKFLDTPVKRYSSGMYVRLAFAVAAHLEPEILIVDEVMAVGDAEFQNKCLGKMSEVSGSGRTVLFVSHNLPAVRSLCSRAIQLQNGMIVCCATAPEVIEHYLRGDANRLTRSWKWKSEVASGDDIIKIQNVSINSASQTSTIQVLTDEPFWISIEYEQSVRLRTIRISIQFLTPLGEVAFTTTDHSERSFETDGPGGHISTCHVPGRLLNRGRYTIRMSADMPGIKIIF